MPTPLPTTSSSTAPVPATVPFTEAGACWFVDGPIDVAAILAAVAAPAAGGNVLFLGTTRGVTADVTTRSLDYEAHETVAVAMLDGLRAEAVAQFGLCGCAIVHRLGRVVVGEASFAIAAESPRTALNSVEPNVVQMRNTPVAKPKSPMRLTTNAFMPAAAASGFSYQNPINR